MRFCLSILLTSLFFIGCRDANDPELQLTFEEILTKQNWQLERYTTPEGKVLTDAELSNAVAITIKSMYFNFNTDKIVTAYDKASKNQISSGRGAWAVSDDKKAISFELIGNKLDFVVISMEKNKMVWQSQTGSFLTGVGKSINLEFSPRL